MLNRTNLLKGMSSMNNLYPYGAPDSNLYARKQEEYDQQIAEAILAGIKREATAIELYRRLADEAPSEQHQHDIRQALENKQASLTQFTNAYRILTGQQPQLEVDDVSFYRFHEGLQKAYEIEVEGYEEYERSSALTENPHVQHAFWTALNTEYENTTRLYRSLHEEADHRVTDHGPRPFVVNIEDETKRNRAFRRALWTGDHLQVTLMSIQVGEDIGLEIHPHLDQFLRVEEGRGLVQMGHRQDNLHFQEEVFDDYAILIPAGTWHNVRNTGNRPLKLYSIYAPPQHPHGTVHETKAIAMAAEEHHHL